MTMPDISAAPAATATYPDTRWYVEITDFARHTKWLNGCGSVYTNYGLGLFALLLLVGWWCARRRSGADAMTAVVCAGIVTVASAALDIVVKSGFTELRPCRVVPGAYLVDPCPPASDYSFPSNHSVIAAAATVGLAVVGVRLGQRWLAWAAVVAMVLMAFSRVYVGAHYPHDVAAGLLLGAATGAVGFWLLPRPVGRLEAAFVESPLRPLLTAAPQTVDGTARAVDPLRAGHRAE